MNSSIQDKLAENAHDSWARWVEHMLNQCTERRDGSFTIPPDTVARWRRQVVTPHECLAEYEKVSDQVEAKRILDVIEKLQSGYTNSTHER